MSLNCTQLKKKYEELMQSKKALENSSDIKTSKIEKSKLEALAKEVIEILLYPGFIYENFLRLKTEHNVDISSIKEVKISPDGVVYGQISVRPETWHTVPFCDGKLVDSLGGVDFRSGTTTKKMFRLPNGKVTGIIERTIKNYFFVSDEIIQNIDGKKVKQAIDFVISENGDMAGTFYGENHDIYFFVNGELYDNIAGLKLVEEKQIDNLHFCSDGVVCGTIRVSDDEVYPFCGDKIKKDIGGEKFKKVHEFHVSPDGKMAGTVTFDGNVFYPFFDDEIIREIDGNVVENARYVDISSDGELFGKVFINGFWYPFLGKKIIKEIGGLEIGKEIFLHFFDKVYITRDGKMCGLASFENEDDNVHNLPYFPFLGDEIIRTIGNIDIESVREVVLLDDDTLYGNFLAGGNWHNFIYNGKEYVLLSEIGKEQGK